MVEQRTENPRVTGSIPVGTTTKKRDAVCVSFFCLWLALFFPALFGHKVGAAQTEQHGHTATERTALVAHCAVARRQHRCIATGTVTIFAWLWPFLEHATAVMAVILRKRGHTETEYDCDC